MRSIVYGGRDFAELCAAEVLGRAAPCVDPDEADVPGRAGALLLGGRVPVGSVRVRLMLDPGFDPGSEGAAEARRALRAWLTLPEGGTLALPGDPGLVWRDAVCVEAGEWDSNAPDACCEVTFELTDPVAYGRLRDEADGSFGVGGTWPTWPVFTLTADAGDAVCVADALSGEYVLVERDFEGGEAVVVDCGDETCLVDGEDAAADVALGSDFFALAPGDAELEFSGCTAFRTAFFERWL